MFNWLNNILNYLSILLGHLYLQRQYMKLLQYRQIF